MLVAYFCIKVFFINFAVSTAKFVSINLAADSNSIEASALAAFWNPPTEVKWPDTWPSEVCISPIAVSAVEFEPVASDTFVAVIPAVVFIVVVLPSASLVTPKVFALVPRIAMLWNFAEDTIASMESLTEIASAFNAAVSDASFV